MQWWKSLALCSLMLVLLGACGSTSSGSTKASGPAAEIATEMISAGAPLSNIRPVPRTGKQAQKVSDSEGFDIPNVDLKGTPAGIIQIYTDDKQAKFDADLPKLLGGSGMQTKQPFSTFNDKAVIMIDYRVDPKVAEVYLNIFRTARVSEILRTTATATTKGTTK